MLNIALNFIGNAMYMWFCSVYVMCSFAGWLVVGRGVREDAVARGIKVLWRTATT